MREIKSHTSMRGIAAILVVIYHYRLGLPSDLNPDQFTGFFEKGYLWVDCFFMLSGFILCHVYGTSPAESAAACRRFSLARFARIYPLHLATLVTMLGLSILASVVHHQTFAPNWPSFFLNLTLTHAWGPLDAFDWNFPSWSISVEFAAYLVFPFICLALLRARWAALVIMISAFVAALFIGREHWERTALLHGIPMFFAGIVVFYAPKGVTSSAAQVAAISVMLPAMHFGWPDWITTICFAVLIYATQTDEGPISKAISIKPILSLGAYSYSIYMLHIPVRSCFGWIFPHAGAVPSFFAMITVTVLAGAVSYHLFEMPLRRWIASGFRRQTISTSKAKSIPT